LHNTEQNEKIDYSALQGKWFNLTGFV